MKIFTKVIAAISAVACFGLAFCDGETTPPPEQTAADATATQPAEPVPDAAEPVPTENQQ